MHISPFPPTFWKEKKAENSTIEETKGKNGIHLDLINPKKQTNKQTKRLLF